MFPFKIAFEGTAGARSGLLVCTPIETSVFQQVTHVDGHTQSLKFSVRQLARRWEMSLTPEVGFAGSKIFSPLNIMLLFLLVRSLMEDVKESGGLQSFV